MEEASQKGSQMLGFKSRTIVFVGIFISNSFPGLDPEAIS